MRLRLLAIACGAGALVSPREVLIVDGDNVRGKTGWRWTNAALVDRLARATRASEPPLAPLVVFDHGLECDARWSAGVAVSFAGPSQTADDAIVAAARWLVAHGGSVTVFTSDAELRGRVGRARRGRDGGEGAGARALESQSLIALLSSGLVLGGAAPVPPDIDGAATRALEAEAAAARDDVDDWSAGVRLAPRAAAAKVSKARFREQRDAIKKSMTRYYAMRHGGGGLGAGSAEDARDSTAELAELARAARTSGGNREETWQRRVHAEALRRALTAEATDGGEPRGPPLEETPQRRLLAQYIAARFGGDGAPSSAAVAPSSVAFPSPPAVSAAGDAPQDERRALVALDLGLSRAAFAVFDGDGSLRACDDVDASPPSDARAPSAAAPPDADSVARVARAVPARAAHVTVVVKLGKSDAEHQAAWSAALGDALRQRRDDDDGTTTVVVAVDALTWRSALLLPRERKSVAAAQSAARDIARQLLGDRPSRRLSAEVAEAVCVGHWAVTTHLQWRSVRRPVERYTNGRIVKKG